MLLQEHPLGSIRTAADRLLTLAEVSVLGVLSIFWIGLLIVANTHIHTRVSCLLFPELSSVYKMNIGSV